MLLYVYTLLRPMQINHLVKGKLNQAREKVKIDFFSFLFKKMDLNLDRISNLALQCITSTLMLRCTEWYIIWWRINYTMSKMKVWYLWTDRDNIDIFMILSSKYPQFLNTLDQYDFDDVFTSDASFYHYGRCRIPFVIRNWNTFLWMAWNTEKCSAQCSAKLCEKKWRKLCKIQ